MKRNSFITLTLAMLIVLVISNLVIAGGLLQKAESELKTAIKKNDMDKAEQAIEMIAKGNDKKSFDVLVKYLRKCRKGNDNLYWAIIGGFAKMNSPEALEAIEKMILEKDNDLSKDILFGLKSNASPRLIPLMGKIITKGGAEYKYLAIEYLEELKSTESITEMVNHLVELEKDAPPLAKKIKDYLRDIAGEDVGESASAWISWWNENKDMDLDASGGATNVSNATDLLSGSRATTMEKAKKGGSKILVVSSNKCKCGKPHNFDYIERTLAQMNIPHKVIDKADIEEDSFSFDGAALVVFNCNMFREHCACPKCKPGGNASMRLFTCTGCDVHIPVSTKYSPKAVEKIRKFVENGGYIFTEDWELEEVVEPAFKGYINHSAYFNDRYVHILPARGSGSHPLLKGVFERPVMAQQQNGMGTSVYKPQLKIGEGTWKLDKDGPNIVVKNKKAVTVLMMSPDLEKENKDASAVAVVFGYTGKKRAVATGGVGQYDTSSMLGGKVMHVVSHFGKQKSKTDEFALQNLLLNFVLEALERHK